MPDKTKEIPGENGHEPGCGFHENPELFFNRELSWIEFNRRVLDEAGEEAFPLLERVKFLSIFSNNLDEFFMIRVAGLKRQLLRGVREAPPDGMSPAEQLEEIHRLLDPLLARHSKIWVTDLVPALRDAGIHILLYDELEEPEKEDLSRYFRDEIFPVLTPLAFDKSHPFPFISNLSLNLAVVLRDPQRSDRHFARVKIPSPLFPRLIQVRRGGEPAALPCPTRMVFLEDLIMAHLDLLFPGYEVLDAYPFRVTRDADMEIEEDEASDLLTAVEEGMEMRRVGSPARVEVVPGMPEETCAIIGKKLGITDYLFYRVDPPLGMADLMVLHGLDRPDLKDPQFTPQVPSRVGEGRDIFAAIREKDLMLFHPYESFSPFIMFLRHAATDPAVLAIKITLYRVGPDSPVVDALLEAREHGKAVAALIELKARFDEENNIGWARALERAGVHVAYGLAGLKVHAKVCMVVRKERDGMIRYVHLSTGNYNAATSRIYTDIGIFTCNDQIGADAADLFNSLTGCARVIRYKKILVAPHSIRDGIIARIEREIVRQQRHGDGRIIFKMNALVDRDCIMALYRASQAGVLVTLQVRGICCLRPGLPGISEHITVTSIVGRFLEHTRIYYFRNGGDEEVLLGSADLMPRNLDRRVEVLFPVEDREIRAALVDAILPVHLRDNCKSRRLLPDGSYESVRRDVRESLCNAQEWCISHRGIWQGEPDAG